MYRRSYRRFTHAEDHLFSADALCDFVERSANQSRILDDRAGMMTTLRQSPVRFNDRAAICIRVNMSRSNEHHAATHALPTIPGIGHDGPREPPNRCSIALDPDFSTTVCSDWHMPLKRLKTVHWHSPLANRTKTTMTNSGRSLRLEQETRFVQIERSFRGRKSGTPGDARRLTGFFKSVGQSARWRLTREV